MKQSCKTHFGRNTLNLSNARTKVDDAFLENMMVWCLFLAPNSTIFQDSCVLGVPFFDKIVVQRPLGRLWGVWVPKGLNIPFSGVAFLVRFGVIFGVKR